MCRAAGGLKKSIQTCQQEMLSHTSVCATDPQSLSDSLRKMCVVAWAQYAERGGMGGFQVVAMVLLGCSGPGGCLLSRAGIIVL